jgi:hypothetical protein
MHPRDWYLTIDVDKRDVTEYPVLDEIDIDREYSQSVETAMAA